MFIDHVDWSFLWSPMGTKPNLEDQFSEWLYGNYDKDKLTEFQMLYAVPGINTYMDYLLDKRDTADYLKRYGMDYSDIRDPRKLSSTGSASRLYGSAYTMISRNVSRLYR